MSNLNFLHTVTRRYAQWVLLLLLGCLPLLSSAQEERKIVREGNRHYANGEFDKAIDAYNEGLQLNDESYAAAFNLADALYKNGQFEEASSQFNQLAQSQEDQEKLGDLFHNIGNTFMEQQKYSEAAESYKQALRNDPGDEDTRYNLSYAMQKILQQQQQEQQQQQNQDKNQDKNQEGDKQESKGDGEDDQDQDQEKNQEDENQEEKEGDKQDQNEKSPGDQEEEKKGNQGDQPEPGEMSKEDAERILEALQNQEQDLQEKMDKKKAKTTTLMIEKDW